MSNYGFNKTLYDVWNMKDGKIMHTSQPKRIDYIVRENSWLFKQVYSFYFSQLDINNICLSQEYNEGQTGNVTSAFYVGPSDCLNTNARLYSIQDAVDKIKWS